MFVELVVISGVSERHYKTLVLSSLVHVLVVQGKIGTKKKLASTEVWLVALYDLLL